MDALPGYVSIVFILTTFAAIAFLLHAAKEAGADTFPFKLLIFLLPLWIFFQAALALGGFYQQTAAFPPRLPIFGVLPAVLLIVAYFIFFTGFIDRLPLRWLTLLHVVRVPVELVLYWLFLGGQVPESMTFAGRNFDIVSGILAPIVYIATFKANISRLWILLAFNILAFILLAVIVSTAVISLPSMQLEALDQPNRAVLFFPYVWLPTIVVPIVLFAHLAAFVKLFRGRDQ